jgi:beta-carotene 3-hydroxylase
VSALASVALVLVAFVTMELVSYLTHRYVMHGFGMRWHRSHHRPPTGRFERNDLFPVCFSSLGFGLFLVSTLVPALAPLFWVGAGVTLYGALYLFVHEISIHRRLRVPMPRTAYLEWLRESHRAHHHGSGEPYGMLLPFRAGRIRGADPIDDQSLDRSGAAASARRRSRSSRARL